MSLPQLLVLEGPDGCGKTTLARQLAEEHGYMHIAHGPEPGMGSHALFSQYARALSCANRRRVVIDRAWLSEHVYGSVHRDFIRLDSFHERMLSRIALSFGGAHVFCMPPLEHCLRVFNSRRDQEMLESNEAMAAVYGMYEHLFYHATYQMPHVIYDITGGDTFDNVLTRLKSVRALRHDCRPQHARHVIGAWQPGRTTLIVGDGPLRNEHRRFPFVGTETGSEAAWFTRRLDMAGVPERQLTFVHATDANWRWTDGSFLEDLQPARVIATGKVAAAWCSRYTDEYRVIPTIKQMQVASNHDPLLDALQRPW